MASSAVVPHTEITKEQFASHLSQYPAVLEAISESKGGTSKQSLHTHILKVFNLICYWIKLANVKG